jgi:hypothetical protein
MGHDEKKLDENVTQQVRIVPHQDHLFTIQLHSEFSIPAFRHDIDTCRHDTAVFSTPVKKRVPRSSFLPKRLSAVPLLKKI